jgi:hypothetical protein
MTYINIVNLSWLPLEITRLVSLPMQDMANCFFIYKLVILCNGFLGIYRIKTLLEREIYFLNTIYQENAQSTPVRKSCGSVLNKPNLEIITSIDYIFISLFLSVLVRFIIPREKQQIFLLLISNQLYIWVYEFLFTTLRILIKVRKNPFNWSLTHLSSNLT